MLTAHVQIQPLSFRESGFTKDEKYKAITMETSQRLTGTWTDVPQFSLAQLQGYEGPEAYVIEPGTGGKPPVWGLILDHYSKGRRLPAVRVTKHRVRQFEPGEGFSFPFPFRHGAVLPVSEFTPLQRAYSSTRAHREHLDRGR
jgi:hypothetical protein